MTDKTMTKHDAAVVAIQRMGAPADIAEFHWYEASMHGETFSRVQVAGTEVSIRLDHSDTTTYGTLRVGWNTDHRVAAFSWEPAE